MGGMTLLLEKKIREIESLRNRPIRREGVHVHSNSERNVVEPTGPVPTHSERVGFDCPMVGEGGSKSAENVQHL